MNLDQFKQINVLSLPVIHIDYPPTRWPRAFFLQDYHHIIYVERTGTFRVVLYDSLGRSAPQFCRAFTGWDIHHYFGTRVLQRNVRSNVCALHVVLFSLKLYCTAPEYRMKAILPALLRRLKRDPLALSSLDPYLVPLELHVIRSL